MKDDERRLLLLIAAPRPEYDYDKPYDENVTIRSIVRNSGINDKRCWYILEKWTRQGLYKYGVSVAAGWLTEKGKEIAENVKQASRSTD